MPRLLVGRPIADAIAASLRERIRQLNDNGRKPTLAVVSVRPGPSARVYQERLTRVAEKLGMRVLSEEAPDPSSMLDAIERANRNDSVHGVVALAPLPDDVDPMRVIERIATEKDVEGVHPLSAGRLAIGEPTYIPSTAEAVLLLIKESGLVLAGAHAVVVGRSTIVGRPSALLLLRENATVSVAHRATRNLPDLTRSADVLVAAVGSPGLIRGNMIKPGAVVADAGTTVTPSGVVGDVDFASAAQVASAITPVPGGVGALTTVLLLRNVVHAAESQS